LPAGSSRIANLPAQLDGFLHIADDVVAADVHQQFARPMLQGASQLNEAASHPARRLEPGIGQSLEGLHLPAKQVCVEAAQCWRILGGNIDVNDGMLLDH
jgi:hypothetical protein